MILPFDSLMLFFEKITRQDCDRICTKIYKRAKNDRSFLNTLDWLSTTFAPFFAEGRD